MKKLLLLFGAVVLVGVPRANATLEIRLTNGVADTGWLQCGDAGITCLNVGGDQSIIFVGTIGNFSINVSTGKANNGVSPYLDLNSINSTGAATPGTLLVQTIADDFTAPAQGFMFQVNGNGTLGGTVTFNAYGGTNNALCPFGVNACTPASAGLGAISTVGPADSSNFNLTGFGPGNTVTPYSLAITATIAAANAGAVSYDAALIPVPEPATVALLGGLLLVTSGAVRRKMRRS